MIINKLDSIEFRLNELHDFNWLKKYGTAFWAVDFYDGSIIYDFSTNKTTICDIDLFQKALVINDRGTGWFGTKRFKAPEEYIKGSIIDEQTNIFTLGALIFEFFGTFSDEEIKQRY